MKENFLRIAGKPGFPSQVAWRSTLIQKDFARIVPHTVVDPASLPACRADTQPSATPGRLSRCR